MTSARLSDSAAAFDALLETLREGVALATSAAFDEREAAEGYRFFTHLLRAGLASYLENDPLHPRFTPLCHTLLKQAWAQPSASLDLLGPVPHAIYDLAPLDGSSRYRIVGRRGSVSHLSMCLYSGGDWSGVMPERIGDSLNQRSLVCDAEGEFEIAIGREPKGAANFLELDPDAHSILVRQFFGDPDLEEPARYRIERVPAAGRAAPLTDHTLAQRLRAVRRFVQTTGNEHFQRNGQVWPALEGDAPNAFPDLRGQQEHGAVEELGRGSAAGVYRSPEHRFTYLHYAVEADQALVLRMSCPDADWWTIYAQSRYVQTNVDRLDDRNTIGANNVVSDEEGRALVVASHRDPGLPNWLDLAGRESGQIILIWSAPERGTSAQPPRIESRVAPVANLPGLLATPTRSLESG